MMYSVNAVALNWKNAWAGRLLSRVELEHEFEIMVFLLHIRQATSRDSEQ